MTESDVIREMKETGIIAIIRRLSQEAVLRTVEALSDAGVRLVEVTADTPGAPALIERIGSCFGGQIIVGAGTVLDTDSATGVIQAGAEFIISPVLDPQVVSVVLQCGKVAIPGAMTPTEILSATLAGAQAVKVFPAGVLGPSYVSQVLAPLPYLRLVPTGGVSLANAGEFMAAGAFALAVGGSLVDGRAIRDGQFGLIRERAKSFLEAIKCSRAQTSESSQRQQH